MFNFAQVSSRSIGTIMFDVVTTEDHQSDLSITENPIESGA
ncbi:MAG: phage baseplate protein, partial [Haemophilus seminalis]